MVEKLAPEETELVGSWIDVDGHIVGDAVCKRIELLTSGYLEKLGLGPYGAWETLYRDLQDGRLWERTFPHSEWHGGGPTALRNLPEAEARRKYPNLF